MSFATFQEARRECRRLGIEYQRSDKLVDLRAKIRDHDMELVEEIPEEIRRKLRLLRRINTRLTDPVRDYIENLLERLNATTRARD